MSILNMLIKGDNVLGKGEVDKIFIELGLHIEVVKSGFIINNQLEVEYSTNRDVNSLNAFHNLGSINEDINLFK
jgi:hypothetical protein